MLILIPACGILPFMKEAELDHDGYIEVYANLSAIQAYYELRIESARQSGNQKRYESLKRIYDRELENYMMKKRLTLEDLVAFQHSNPDFVTSPVTKERIFLRAQEIINESKK